MRYTRQELKQDKLKETAAGAFNWGSEHRSTVFTTIAGAVIVVALVLGGYWFFQHRSEQANTALGAAMQINNAPIAPKGAAPEQVTTYPTVQERAAAAKTAFYDVASKYGSTRAGRIAKYMAGQNEVDLGNLKAAEDDFKAVADSSDSSVAALAKFALASLYRDTNRDNDAIAIYKALIDHPTDTMPKTSAQLELADLYAAKQPEEAKKIYAQIQQEDKKSTAAQIAEQKLAALK